VRPGPLFIHWLCAIAAASSVAAHAAVPTFKIDPLYSSLDGSLQLTLDEGVRDAMLAQGWLSEGHGDAGVAFCVPFFMEP